MAPVLISRGCRNKHTTDRELTRHTFLPVLEATESKAKVPEDSVSLVRASFLTEGRLSTPGGGRQETPEVSFMRALVLFTSIPPCDLSISQRPPSTYKGGSVSTYEWGGVWAEIFSL